MQNHVITEQQARQITGGRKPLVPVEYEQAVAALRACQTIEDAKYWSDAADALAAWAKMAHDETALDEARKLKARARRTVAILAETIRPTAAKSSRDGKCTVLGCAHKIWAAGQCQNHYAQKRRLVRLKDGVTSKGGVPGAASLLREHGMTTKEITQGRRLARIPDKEFEVAVESGMSRRILELRGRGLGNRAALRSEAWVWLTELGPKLSSVRSHLRAKQAKDVAAAIRSEETGEARKLVVEIQEWLDEFEQYLPKG